MSIASIIRCCSRRIKYKYEYGPCVEWAWWRKHEALRENPVPVPSCSTQMSYRPVWDRTLSHQFAYPVDEWAVHMPTILWQHQQFLSASNEVRSFNRWTVWYNYQCWSGGIIILDSGQRSSSVWKSASRSIACIWWCCSASRVQWSSKIFPKSM